MVIYKCETCSKIFDKKCNYERHLAKKNKCSPIKILEPLKKELNITNIEDDGIFICDFCDRSFKNKNYFRKHLRELCPKNLKFEQIILREKLRKITKIRKENFMLKEKIFEKMKTLPKYIVENGKIINVEKHYVNYYDQKNIFSYGNECLKHIKDKMMKKIINNPEMGLVTLIQMIHFNNDIPKNRNVFMRNRKSNMIEFFKDGDWRTMPKKDLFQNLIVSKKDIMDDFYDKLLENNELSEKTRIRYDVFSNNLDKIIQHLVFETNYDNSLKRAKLIYERIFKLINLLFLNNQKIEVVVTPIDNLKQLIDDLDDEMLDEKIRELEERDDTIIEEIKEV